MIPTAPNLKYYDFTLIPVRQSVHLFPFHLLSRFPHTIFLIVVHFQIT